MLRHIASGKAVTILNEPSEIQSRVKMCVSSSLTAGSFFSIMPTFKVGTVQTYFRSSVFTYLLSYLLTYFILCSFQPATNASTSMNATILNRLDSMVTVWSTAINSILRFVCTCQKHDGLDCIDWDMVLFT